MRKLKSSVVVITGASSGIGRATALAFADAGAAVVVSARRRAPLEELAEECRSRGVQAEAVVADVRDPDATEQLARETAGRFGRIDVWVNNASVIQYGRFDEVPVDEWHEVFATNVFGYYHGMRAAVPYLREQGEGVIVNVGSVLSKVPAPFQSAYVASKHAVKALTECVRQELLDVEDIEVSLVVPGAIDTPLFQHAANHTGRKPKAPRPVIDPERVAAAIVSCAKKPQREVAVGASTRSGLLNGKLAPGLTERAAARAMADEQFLDEPAESTSGNVFDPVPHGTDVRGGWQEDGGGTLRTLAAVGAAGVAAAAAVARLRSDE
jgi:short-subunit dehydrogenase